MKYFKREWPESRGDDFNHWGKSVWYFETNDIGLPVKQIEVYESGKVLKYSSSKLEDEYGSLGDQEFDLVEFATYEISESEFNEMWLHS